MKDEIYSQLLGVVFGGVGGQLLGGEGVECWV